MDYPSRVMFPWIQKLREKVSKKGGDKDLPEAITKNSKVPSPRKVQVQNAAMKNVSTSVVSMSDAASHCGHPVVDSLIMSTWGIMLDRAC